MPYLDLMTPMDCDGDTAYSVPCGRQFYTSETHPLYKLC